MFIKPLLPHTWDELQEIFLSDWVARLWSLTSPKRANLLFPALLFLWDLQWARWCSFNLFWWGPFALCSFSLQIMVFSRSLLTTTPRKNAWLAPGVSLSFMQVLHLNYQKHFLVLACGFVEMQCFRNPEGLGIHPHCIIHLLPRLGWPLLPSPLGDWFLASINGSCAWHLPLSQTPLVMSFKITRKISFFVCPSSLCKYALQTKINKP